MSDSGRPPGPSPQACIHECQLGTSVTKFGRSGKPAPRVIFISPDGTAVCWQSKRKRPQDSRIQFSDIERVQRGQHTATFARHGKQYQSAASRSLSIVCASGRTLDVVFGTQAEADTWIAALEACHVAHLRAAHYADSDQKRLCRLFYEAAAGTAVSRSTSGASALLSAVTGSSKASGSAQPLGAPASTGGSNSSTSVSVWRPSTWLRRGTDGHAASSSSASEGGGEGAEEEEPTISYAQLKALLRRLNIVYKGRDGTRRLREVFSMVVASTDDAAGVVAAGGSGETTAGTPAGGAGGAAARPGSGSVAPTTPSRGRSISKVGGLQASAAAGAPDDDGAALTAAAAAAMPPGRLGLAGFLRLVDLLRDRPDITAVFNEWCAGDKLEALGSSSGGGGGGVASTPQQQPPPAVMPIATFHKFLVHAQQERLTSLDDAKRAAALFGPAMATAAPAGRRAEGGEGDSGGAEAPSTEVSTFLPPVTSGMPHSYYSNVTGITLPGFIAYLTSGHNAAFAPAAARHEEESMDAPLAHYWIASSHNTYLEGDQFASSSSVNQYITALCKGCRCVELDCWDGPAPGYEPVIYHGHTLTSRIAFQDVVQALADYGFQASPYPLILSLEVHCSPRQQERMVEVMEALLGDDVIARPPPHVVAAVASAMGHDQPLTEAPAAGLASLAWVSCDHGGGEAASCNLCSASGNGASPAALSSHSWECLPSPRALVGKVLVKAKLKKKKVTASAASGAAEETGAATPVPSTPAPTAAAAVVSVPPAAAAVASGSTTAPPTVMEVSVSKCFPAASPSADSSAPVSRASSFKGLAGGGGAPPSAPASPAARKSLQRGTGAGATATPNDGASKLSTGGGGAIDAARPASLSSSAATGGGGVSITLIPRLNAALYLPTLKFTSWEDCAARHTPWHMVSLKESMALRLLGGGGGGEAAVTSTPSAAAAVGAASQLVRSSPSWSGALAGPSSSEAALSSFALGAAATGAASPGVAGGGSDASPASAAALSVYTSPGYAAMARHTSSRLIRIYPKVSRLNSSNFNPVPFWAAGVQMVALNYQTADVPMRLNRALFRLNGRCGYVLKPAQLRQGSGAVLPQALPPVHAPGAVMTIAPARAKMLPASGVSSLPGAAGVEASVIPQNDSAEDAAAAATSSAAAAAAVETAAPALPAPAATAAGAPEAAEAQTVQTVSADEGAVASAAASDPVPSTAAAPPQLGPLAAVSRAHQSRWLSTPLRHSASMSPEPHPAATTEALTKPGSAAAIISLEPVTPGGAGGLLLGGRGSSAATGGGGWRPPPHRHLSALATATISHPDTRLTGPTDPTYATVMSVVGGGGSGLARKEAAASPLLPTPAAKRLLLTVEVMGAQHLPKRPGAAPESASRVPSPFVSLALYGGHPEPQRARTRAIASNGFNPAWRETFTFLVPDPSVSFLYIAVNDQAEVKGSHFLGYFAVPVQALRWGYRCCPLRDAVGKKFPLSTILARFTASPLNE